MAEKTNYTVNPEKSSKFLQAIQKYADKQREKINDEAAQFKAAELKQAEDDALKEAYKLIHHELGAMHLSISSEMAKRAEAGKKEIYKRRNEITEEVFEKAKASLIKFTDSDQYKNQLQADIQEIISFFAKQAVTLYACEKDKALCTTLLPAQGNFSVCVDKDIQIGGVRGVCGQTVVDKTLDTKLEGQRDWFYRKSGLKVSL